MFQIDSKPPLPAGDVGLRRDLGMDIGKGFVMRLMKRFDDIDLIIVLRKRITV